MLKSEALKIIKQFVEGKLDINSFKNICIFNQEFREQIKDCQNMNIGKEYNYEILKMLDHINWKNFSQQDKIHLIFLFYLVDNNIKDFKETEMYLEKARYYSDLIPDWLSDDAMTYVDEKIIEKVPESFSEKDKKKWIKQQIKETFKYEKRPPEFAQEGVWPQDEDGKFLVFRNQKQKGDLVTYTFVNPKTKQEIECQEMF